MISTDSLLGSFTAPFEHGLLVIEDPATSSRHDDWIAATEKVHRDHDSLYVTVQGSVDGPVSVEVHGVDFLRDPAVEMIIRFSGELPLASRVLRVSDSDNAAVLSLRTKADPISIRIMVDDDDWPARVVIVLGE